MPLVDELLGRVSARVREQKEATVKGATGNSLGATDVHAMVQGYRGNEPVVSLMPMEIDRDPALHAAWIAAVGFGCDVIALTTEGWTAKSLINPVTGKQWGPREMQDAVENHDALAKGWVVGGLTTIVVNRAGDLTGTVEQYTIHSKTSALGITTHTIEWLPTPRGLRFTNEGYVPESLIEYMNHPDVGTLMARAGIRGADFGLTIEEARAHADCAVVKMLPKTGWEGAVLLMSDNEERSAVIDRSLVGRGHGA